MIETKKSALIRILQILERETDEKHAVSQDDIVDILERDYGIEIERKAVGRDIALLKDVGYNIESGRGGTKLLDRTFDDSELRLLIDSVLASNHIPEKQTLSLIKRLSSFSSKYFKSHISHVFSVNDWQKSDNTNLFYNIHVINNAIETNTVVEYDYNKYGTDKKLHKTSSQSVTPYQLVLHNQRYYLMGYSMKWDHMVFHRLDKITEIRETDDAHKPLRSIPGYESGINYKELSTARPYMFSDKPERIDFYVTEYMVDQVIDWFGKNITIMDDKGRLRVSVISSPNAMLYWALQYLDSVEVIRPAKLRNEIKDALNKGLEKYRE